MESGDACAIKIVDKSATTQPPTDGEESQILSAVRHPNIVHLRQILETPTEICYVLERLESDLYNVLYKKRRLEEDTVRHVASKLLSCLSYLHGLDIAHRDIKLENILVDTTAHCSSKGGMVVKLADFGYAKCLTETNKPVGTSFYQCPEILMAQERRTEVSAEDAKSGDMFAVGVVLFYLLCGRPPFMGNTWPPSARHALFAAMRTPPKVDDARFPNAVSAPCRSLITQLLSSSAKDRLTADQAARHEWISEVAQTSETEGQSSEKTQVLPIPSSPLVPCIA